MSALSIEAVDRIFNRLAGTYMGAWDRFLGATPILDAKTIWANELGIFSASRTSMERIAWALSNLPERPPNVIEFKKLCQQAPAPVEPLQIAAKPDPERVAAELEKLAPLRNVVASHREDRLDWARRLKAKDEMNPRSVTSGVRTMYKEALRAAGAV
jgi:hypothetical protein